MHLHALDYALWIATPVVQGWVIYFLHRRGLASEFPIFYAYTILQVTTDIVLFFVERVSYTAYFYTYWIVIAATVLMTFTLIDELFRLAFHGYDALQSVGSQIFRWIVLLMVLGACGLAFTLPTLRNASEVGEFILLGDRCARIMLCLWALLLIIGSPLMRISPRSMLFGIAVGVVVFACSKIVTDTVFLSQRRSSHFASRINSFMYLASCTLWLAYAAYGEGLPAYEPLLGDNNARPSDGQEEEEKRSLMETINDTVDRLLRNPS